MNEAHLYESDIGPLVATVSLVEGEKIRQRPLQKFGVQLVADVVDDDDGGLPYKRLLLRIKAENRAD